MFMGTTFSLAPRSQSLPTSNAPPRPLPECVPGGAKQPSPPLPGGSSPTLKLKLMIRVSEPFRWLDG